MATHAVSPQRAPFESKKRVTKATLTELTVRSLKAGTYHDGKTPGFGIRIGKLKKTWFVVRTKGRIQTVVGHYPEMGLADARTAARRLLVEEPIAKSASLPFSAARDAYLDQHTGRESTKREIRRLLTKHFAALDAQDVKAITDADIQARLKDLAPSEKLHAFRAARAAFRWFTRPPRRYITHSPLEGYAPPSVDGRKTRVMSDDEVQAVLRASQGQPGAIIRLILLWGTRIGETLSLRRDWVVDGVMVIPGKFTKNGRQHTIPILPLAQSILDEQKERGPFFFPGRWDPTTHMNAGSWGKFHRAMLEASNTANWTAHDARRSFRSQCAKRGVSRDIAERLLNHAQGVLDEIYDRHDYLEEKKEALAKIEKWISDLLPKEPVPQ